MPGRFPDKKSKQKKKKNTVELVTANDYFDEAVLEEEHGDRWVDSGDIPKAIRFYQRAEDYYKQAIGLASHSILNSSSRSSNQLTPSSSSNSLQKNSKQQQHSDNDLSDQEIIDNSSYNYARMQYLIFSKLVKTGEIDNLDPARLGVRLDGSGVVPLDIQQVLVTQTNALAAVSQPPSSLDHLYTYAQVLQEAGEEAEDMAMVKRACEIFGEILGKQLETLDELEKEQVEEGISTTTTVESSLSSSGTATNSNNNNSNQQQMQVLLSSGGVAPGSVLETITSMFSGFNTILEFYRRPDTSTIEPVDDVVHSLAGIQKCVYEMFSLISKQTNYNQQQGGMRFEIPKNVIDDCIIALAQILGTCAESLDVLYMIWVSPSLPYNTTTTPLSQQEQEQQQQQENLIKSQVNDLIQKVFGDDVINLLIQQFGNNANNNNSSGFFQLPNTMSRYLAAGDSFFGYAERVGLSDTDKWSAYSKSLTVLKKAWELVSSSSASTIRATSLEKLQVLSARGDAELLRSKLSTPAAEKHRLVLMKNARNMYQSADNVPLINTEGNDNKETGGMVRLTSSSPEIVRLKREIHIKIALLDNNLEAPVMKTKYAPRIIENLKDQGLF